MSKDKTYTEVVREFEMKLEEFKKHFNKQNADMRADIKEIKAAIIGDDFGNKGISGRLDHNEKRMDGMEADIQKNSNFKYKILGAVAVIAFVLSFVGGRLAEAIFGKESARINEVRRLDKQDLPSGIERPIIDESRIDSVDTE